MTEREALNMALKALENIKNDPFKFDLKDDINKVTIAIKEALAQPEQEPVAFINVEQRKLEWAKYMTWDTPTVVNLPKIPLYTTPPQRKPLTNEEITQAFNKAMAERPKDASNAETNRLFVRAIEAAHGIKGEA